MSLTNYDRITVVKYHKNYSRLIYLLHIFHFVTVVLECKTSINTYVLATKQYSSVSVVTLHIHKKSWKHTQGFVFNMPWNTWYWSLLAIKAFLTKLGEPGLHIYCHIIMELSATCMEGKKGVLGRVGYIGSLPNSTCKHIDQLCTLQGQYSGWEAYVSDGHED